MIILILISSILIMANAMIGKDSFELSSADSISILWSFEFDRGGSLNVSVNVNDISNNRNISAQVFVCSDSQLSAVKAAKFSDLCDRSAPNALNLCAAGRILNYVEHETRIDLIVEEKDWFNLVQLNCDGISYQLELGFIAENPGGEFLSLSQIPNKYLYLVLGIGWAGIGILWSFHCFRYRAFNISLQLMMLVVPGAQVLDCFLWNYLWELRSSTGVDNFILKYSLIVVDSVLQGVLVFALFLLSEGYGILVKRIERTRLRNILVLVLALIVLNAVYEYFGGFVMFSVVLFYCVALRIMFSSILKSSNKLLRQISLLKDARLDSANSPAAEKYHIIKRFQNFTVGFLCTDVIFQLWAKIFLQKTSWICDLTSECLLLIYSVTILYTIRMRPFYPRLWLVENSDDRGDNPENDSLFFEDEFRILRSYNILPMNLWSPGHQVPSGIKRNNFDEEDSESVIAIQNPPTIGDYGHKVESFSIAHKIM
jgi:hypothetical protein